MQFPIYNIDISSLEIIIGYSMKLFAMMLFIFQMMKKYGGISF